MIFSRILPPGLFINLVLCIVFSGLPRSEVPAPDPADSDLGSFVEESFPFFAHVLDARKLGEEWPENNLTPRGIILHLGDGIHACFDTDLLRLALVWEEKKDGTFLMMNSMAAGSYSFRFPVTTRYPDIALVSH